MLTEAEWKLIKKQMPISCNTPVIPFVWNIPESYLSPTQSKLKLIFCYFCASLSFSYTSLTTITLVQHLHDSAIGDLVMHFLTVTWYCTVTVNQFNAIICREDIASLFNSIEKMNSVKDGTFYKGLKRHESRFSRGDMRTRIRVS
ncbi:unnamed protein product [Allacma fusca]|uniref:Uncharacterized protein n=1 Tax=Allacma fusca TaxID=39272 RepID=A0A8J2P790_9HEXA|nr:unnamed protein product [Allacma fusca]